MSSDDPDADVCSLCGQSLGATGLADDDANPYCSPGCRAVGDTLGSGGTDDLDSEAGDASARTGMGSEGGDVDVPGGTYSRTFLRVDGMYSATCEAFLERVAEKRDGVRGAQASYVTETIRVDYDSGRISEDELVDALSTLGYNAYPREEETGATDGRSAAGAQRNPRFDQERGLGDMLGYRYAVGVLFGTFLLLPYVALLYPTYLAELVDWGVLAEFSRRVTFTGRGGLFFLRIYLVFTGIVLAFTGLPLLRGAYVSLKMRRADTTLLVALTVVAAYVYSAVAAILGRTDVYFDLTVVVASVVVAAIFYESLAKQRAMDRLTELTIAQADEAVLYGPDGTTTVPVEDLTAGDRVLVREGERAPVDGTLEDGPCTVDEAVVTGESLPVRKAAGDAVVGGSIVTDGAAVVRAGERAESSIDRLVASVWDVQSGTHGVQRRANRLAGRLVPLVAVAAVLAGVASLATGTGLPMALLATLATVVVACPWALGLATPLSVATSVAEATERGIVVFDETVFERLRDVDVVVFDKTGTLTTGEMAVVEADAPADLLRAAGELERRAAHPAADAIAAAFAPDGREASDAQTDGGSDELAEDGRTDGVQSFTSHADGVGGVVDGSEVLVGHPDRFAERGWTVGEDVRASVGEARGFGRLPVVVGRDGRAEGVVVVGDEPRAGWDDTVSRLSERGVEVVVLTGDDEAATDFFRSHPGVSHVFADVPPAGKTATIRRLQAGGTVAMVGDGTNDAPALARADLGISLGGGTAIASDAADVAIVDDDLAAVETAFDLARAARSRVRQNNWLALLYNGLLVPVAVAGLLNPLVAVGAVAATGGLLGLNSSRRLLE